MAGSVAGHGIHRGLMGQPRVWRLMLTERLSEPLVLMAGVKYVQS